MARVRIFLQCLDNCTEKVLRSDGMLTQRDASSSSVRGCSSRNVKSPWIHPSIRLSVHPSISDLACTVSIAHVPPFGLSASPRMYRMHSDQERFEDFRGLARCAFGPNVALHQCPSHIRRAASQSSDWADLDAAWEIALALESSAW